jgi:hypothetical protein
MGSGERDFQVILELFVKSCKFTKNVNPHSMSIQVIKAMPSSSDEKVTNTGAYTCWRKGFSIQMI